MMEAPASHSAEQLAALVSTTYASESNHESLARLASSEPMSFPPSKNEFGNRGPLGRLAPHSHCERLDGIPNDVMRKVFIFDPLTLVTQQEIHDKNKNMSGLDHKRYDNQVLALLASQLPQTEIGISTITTSQSSPGAATRNGGLSKCSRGLLFCGAVITGAVQPFQMCVAVTSNADSLESYMSFCITALMGSAVLLLVPSLLPISERQVKLSEMKPWMFTGGVMLGLGLCMAVVLTSALGPALFFLISVVGQLCSALILEHTAFFCVGNWHHTSVSAWHLLGACIISSSFLLLNFEPDVIAPSMTDHEPPFTVACLVSFFCGGLVPLQACINRRLSLTVGGAVRAALLCSIVGAISLMILQFLLFMELTSLYGSINLPPMEWYAGVVGVLLGTYVPTLIIQEAGISNLCALVVVGSIVGWMCLDALYNSADNLLIGCIPAAAVLALLGALIMVASSELGHKSAHALTTSPPRMLPVHGLNSRLQSSFGARVISGRWSEVPLLDGQHR